MCACCVRVFCVCMFCVCVCVCCGCFMCDVMCGSRTVGATSAMNEPAANPNTMQNMRYCQKRAMNGQNGVATVITSMEP